MGALFCRAVAAALLLLCFVTVQVSAQTAVGPSASVKPLYACSMQLSDLPQFSGTPTPEMLAGNIGLSMGLQGLLSQNPEESCKDLGGGSYGSYGSSDGQYAQQAAAVAGAAVGPADPSLGRHGRRQQRPQRASTNLIAAAGNGAASFAALGTGGRRVADGPAARAYKYRVASLGSAAAAANLTVATASVGVASEGAASSSAAGLNSSAASNSSSNSSSNGTTTAATQDVWSHSPSMRAAHRRQQHQQQQLEAKASRHLLAAEAGSSGEYSTWLAGLFGGEDLDSYDEQADAYVEKQFCGKGSWIASLRPGMTPASVSTAAAAGVRGSNATVGVSGTRNMRLRKGSGGKGGAAHMPMQSIAVDGGYADAYGSSSGSSSGSSDGSLYPVDAMAPKPRRRTGFKPVWGEDGLWMSESGVIPADSTVAVGPRHVMHIVNSLVKITTVDPGHGVPTGTDGYGYEPSPDAVIVTLPDFFGLVASSCDGGYITPSAVYDKHSERFIVTAVCGGDANQILLAVSQCEDATAGWWLYTFPGYVTYDTHMACTDGSNHFEPTSIHTQVGYNKDGVFVSFVQNCPICEVPKATGSVLYALPKWALYCGSSTAVVGPVYTGVDVYHAVGQQDQDLKAASFRQLQPVQPQRGEDAVADIVYFVNDPLSTNQPSHRTRLTTVALINTGSLWQYTCEDDPAPVLVARVTGRGVDCGIDESTKLLQPQMRHMSASSKAPGQCHPLEAGSTRPNGFWSGGAALYAHQIYLTDRGPDLRPKGAKSDCPLTPTVYWAVLSPSFCATGACAAFMGQDWAYDKGWNWHSCSWHAHDQKGEFFHLQPPGRPQETAAPVAAQLPTEPLLQFLTNVANKATGRTLLEAAAAAGDGPQGNSSGNPSAAGQAQVSIAAVGGAAETQQQQEPGASVGVAAEAADPAMLGKGHQKGVQHKHAKGEGSKGSPYAPIQEDSYADAEADASPEAKKSASDADGGRSAAKKQQHEDAAAGGPAAAAKDRTYKLPGVRHAAAKAGASARRSPFLPPAAKSTDDEDGEEDEDDVSYDEDDGGSKVRSEVDEDDTSSSTEYDATDSSTKARASSGKTAGASKTKKSSISDGSSSSNKVADPNVARVKRNKPAAPAHPKSEVMDVGDGGMPALSAEDLDKMAGRSAGRTSSPAAQSDAITDSEVKGTAGQQQQQQPGKQQAQGGGSKQPKPAPALAPSAPSGTKKGAAPPAGQKAHSSGTVAGATPPAKTTPKPFPTQKQTPVPVPRAANRTPVPAPETNTYTNPVATEALPRQQRPQQQQQQQPQQRKQQAGKSHLAKPLAGEDYLPLGAAAPAYAEQPAPSYPVQQAPQPSYEETSSSYDSYEWAGPVAPPTRKPKPFHHPKHETKHHQESRPPLQKEYADYPYEGGEMEYATLPYVGYPQPGGGYEQPPHPHLPQKYHPKKGGQPHPHPPHKEKEPLHQEKKDHREKHLPRKKKWASQQEMEVALRDKSVWELMCEAADHPPMAASHRDYYELWRDSPTVRRVYCKLELEACYNPCKYVKDWHRDTKITFGVLVSRRGVIDAVTNAGENALGLAFPQVIVREGSALVVYSYSGSKMVPGEGCYAFPGVGYSVIPPGQAMGSPAFHLLQRGDSCVYQGPNHGAEQSAWGSYSGADIHSPSGVAYTAVQYATRPGSLDTQPSNAGTWLQAFAPAKGGWKKRNPHYKPPASYYPPPAYYAPGWDTDYQPPAAYQPAYPPPASEYVPLEDDDSGYGSSPPSSYGGSYSPPSYSPPSYSGNNPPSYGGNNPPSYGSGSPPSYGGGSPPSYSGNNPPSYGGGSPPSQPGYGSSPPSYGGSSDNSDYSGSPPSYGGGSEYSGYSKKPGYSGGSKAPEYGGTKKPYYGGSKTPEYGESKKPEYGGSNGGGLGHSSGGGSGYGGSSGGSGYGGSSSGGYTPSPYSPPSGGSTTKPYPQPPGWKPPVGNGYGTEPQYPSNGGVDNEYDYPDSGYGAAPPAYGSQGEHFVTKPHPQPPGWKPPNGAPLPEDGPKYLPVEDDSPYYQDEETPYYGGGEYSYEGGGSGDDGYSESPSYSKGGGYGGSSGGGGYGGSSGSSYGGSSGGDYGGSSGSSGGYSGGYGGSPSKGKYQPAPTPAPPGPAPKKSGNSQKGSDILDTLLQPPARNGQTNLPKGFTLRPQQALGLASAGAAKLQQQQQQGGSSTAQKGMVLPSTGLEGDASGLVQGLAALGNAALKALQQQSQGAGSTAAAAVTLPQPASAQAAAGAALLYFDDYDPVDRQAKQQQQQQQQRAAAAAAAPQQQVQVTAPGGSAGNLLTYLQALGAAQGTDSSRHASSVGVASVAAQQHAAASAASAGGAAQEGGSSPVQRV